MTTGKFRNFLKLYSQQKFIPKQLQVDQTALRRDLIWLEKNVNTNIINFYDQTYPERLKQIPDAPNLLYVQGDLKFLNAPQIAIVGSRTPSIQGLQLAEKFAFELATEGLVVTSGMAIGIDGASHKGAIKAGGVTIAVLGSGLDIIYPQQHVNLSREIIEHGCLISEFPIGTTPKPFNFPQRNRIISGLSLGVLVVEAAEKSGSLITADFAAEQGREIFAVPGSVCSNKVKGCHALIKQGAKLVESITDVLDELVPLLPSEFRGRNATTDARSLNKVKLSEDQQLLMDLMDEGANCVDLMIGKSGLSTSAVGSILLELELQGLVSAVPGGYARLI
jgi:DNA processing protein